MKTNSTKKLNKEQFEKLLKDIIKEEHSRLKVNESKKTDSTKISLNELRKMVRESLSEQRRGLKSRTRK